MVMSRTAKSNHTPSIREVLSSSGRVMSHRVYEFPSLSFRERFGFGTTHNPAPSPQPTSGPLRVTIRLPDSSSLVAPPRRLSTRYSRSYTDDISATTAAESRVGGGGGGGGRRVRFELPPPKQIPLNGGATILGNGSAVKQVAGVDNWLRSRTGYPTVETTSLSSFGGVSGGGTLQQQQYSSTPSSGPSRTTNTRVHDTGRYRKGTLPPTSSGLPPEEAVVTVPKPGVIAVLKAARDADEKMLNESLKMGGPGGLSKDDVNAVDSGGRTAVSYIASHGSLTMLEAILQVSGVDINKPDNEGNTPLHFAAQAGHAEIVNLILSHCSGVKVDARNDLGFTPLMKAALQGRTRCAKLLIFAGASPLLKDAGKGLRAEEWARYCGRYVCAEMILKISRHRLLDRTSSYGRWGSEPELGLDTTKINQPITQTQSHGFKTKLKQAFRTKSNSSLTPEKSRYSSLVTQLTSAALCASTPVLPSRGTCTPAVRSLIRPLAVPKLHVTLVGGNSVESACAMPEDKEVSPKSSGTRSRQIYLKKKK